MPREWTRGNDTLSGILFTPGEASPLTHLKSMDRRVRPSYLKVSYCVSPEPSLPSLMSMKVVEEAISSLSGTMSATFISLKT